MSYNCYFCAQKQIHNYFLKNIQKLLSYGFRKRTFQLI